MVRDETPGLELRRVRGASGIMGLQPPFHILAEAGVKLARIADALQDVDILYRWA
jgi:hypothetical protein